MLQETYAFVNGQLVPGGLEHGKLVPGTILRDVVGYFTVTSVISGRMETGLWPAPKSETNVSNLPARTHTARGVA